MSTKRQPQANEESYQALQALFLKLANGGAASDEVWRQVLAEPWFRGASKGVRSN